jgi:redox-sensitive bicupin YhaK (pirin superfamily)
MTEPQYRDITMKDVVTVEDENAAVRVISGSYKGEAAAVSGNYVKVKYLDVELKPDTVWIYNETPNDETLFRVC